MMMPKQRGGTPCVVAAAVVLSTKHVLLALHANTVHHRMLLLLCCCVAAAAAATKAATVELSHIHVSSLSPFRIVAAATAAVPILAFFPARHHRHAHLIYVVHQKSTPFWGRKMTAFCQNRAWGDGHVPYIDRAKERLWICHAPLKFKMERLLTLKPAASKTSSP